MISGRDERNEVKMRENERERNKAAVLVAEIFLSFATTLKNNALEKVCSPIAAASTRRSSVHVRSMRDKRG